MIVRKFALVVLILFAFVVNHPAVGQAASISTGRPNETVLLVSIDGFRYDYLDSIDAPNLRWIASTGTRARWLIPSFPTKTFPNHYTIVTGLYPGHHGIVANRFYDPAFDAVFNLRDRQEITKSRWWGGEPIWVTAEKQGVKAATLFWPGSESEIGGKRPSYWLPYNESMPLTQRVDQVLAWLDLPVAERPRFLTLYFESVDRANHETGPLTREVREAALHVDDAIGRLLSGLRQRRLIDRTNLIVLSDHGVTGISNDRIIYLDDYIQTNTVRVYEWSPVISLWISDNQVDSVYKRLTGAHSHMKVFKRSRLPAEYHLGDNPRVGPLVLVADNGWEFGTHTALNSGKTIVDRGDHGYESSIADMRATFIAHGPAFESGRMVEPFVNIDVYDLLCQLLGLKPAPNDGNPTTASKLLKQSNQ